MKSDDELLQMTVDMVKLVVAQIQAQNDNYLPLYELLEVLALNVKRLRDR